MEEKDMFEETPGKKPISSPGDVLRVIWQRLWTIMLVAVVLTGSALAFSLAQTPTYKASILIVVGQKTPDEADAPPVRDIADPEMIVATVAQAVDTRPVAEGVVERLNLSEGDAPVVLENMDVAAEPGTTFIEVSYTDIDPERAQLVANAIGAEFSEQVSELNVSATPVTARVWQQATLPESPASPGPVLTGAVALVIGTFLGIGLALMFEYVDGGKTPRKR